jgi:eukaryotic-like serine/threonine-protein kinase
MVDRARPNPPRTLALAAGPSVPELPNPLAGTSYEPIQKLGQGGMGDVWECEHVGLRRRVVVKVIRREHAWSPDFLERLQLEGRSLAAITPHPHIVAVSDFGMTPDGRGFLVMERLRGCTLKDALASRGCFSVVEAVTLVRQLLDGLGAAHRAGILHRDIKLENLFLCDAERGAPRLKILDFGIAKLLGGPGEHGAFHHLTREGSTLGTPRFMSPEQARAEPLDHRTDLYATGIVLYMLLAGRDPFHHHRGVIALLRAQATELPAVPSILAEQVIPEALDRAVLRALSKRPEDRFDSADAFSAELARIIDGASPMRWAATEPLDVSMFRVRPAARMESTQPARWATPSTFQRSGADDPTCVESAPKQAVESDASGHTYLYIFRKSESPTAGFIGASLLAALFAVGLLGIALWSSLSFR